MSLWVELAVIIILAIHNIVIGMIIGVCWIAGKILADEPSLIVVSRILNGIITRLERIEKKLDIGGK